MNTDSNAQGAEPLHITQRLATYSAQTQFAQLPGHVQLEASRAFLNWVGCVLGGCKEDAVGLAAQTVAELGGAPVASIIGSAQRTDVASAAFVNCISSSILAFDDAHLATVTHPSGPVGSALLAVSQSRVVSGEEFLNAFALGIELQCRLSNVLVLPPSQFNVGFYVTGLTGPIGTALAVGRLLKLEPKQMNWAIGLAASQSSGFRATHGTMTAHFRPGHASRSGVWAAMLAAKWFTGDDFSLEADKGFFDVYATGANLGISVEGLGSQHEMLSNSYKPYPCGIVIHPTIDACIDIWQRSNKSARPIEVKLLINPLALKLTGVRHPGTPLESHVSLFHWAAAALLRGTAGIDEMRQDCIDAPEIAALRAAIVAVPSTEVGKDQSIVEVTMSDGSILRSEVATAKGSLTRPMTDAELDAKFMAQATGVLPQGRASELRDLCRNVATLKDVGKEISLLLDI
jgi:2-methylcitrate dehydratase PrpD